MKIFKLTIIAFILLLTSLSASRAQMIYGSVSNFNIPAQYLVNGKIKINSTGSTSIKFRVQFAKYASYPSALFTTTNFKLSTSDGSGNPIDLSSTNSISISDFPVDSFFIWKEYSVSINRSSLTTGNNIYLLFERGSNGYTAYSKSYGWQVDATTGPNYGGMPLPLRQFARENGNLPQVPMTTFTPNDSIPALTVGNSIYSPNQQYRLTLQTDGNLVLYKKTGPTSEQALWYSSTHTNPIKATKMFFQTDGNLVLYTGNLGSTSTWSCGRYNNNNAGLNSVSSNAVYALQDDGNFVFYWIYLENFVYKKWVIASASTNNGVVSPHIGSLI